MIAKRNSRLCDFKEALGVARALRGGSNHNHLKMDTRKTDSLQWLLEFKPVKHVTDIEKQEAFNNWMANIVKHRDYSDHNQMVNAYQRITEVKPAELSPVKI